MYNIKIDMVLVIGVAWLLCSRILDYAGPLYGIEKLRGELRTELLVRETGFVIFRHEVYIGRTFSACVYKYIMYIDKYYRRDLNFYHENRGGGWTYLS